jgi:L-iditol 2-dehydrogenase
LLTWPEQLTYPLPDTLSDVEGALLEPLGVALHALDLGRVQPGTSAGVFGCGPIGLLLVQALRAAGVTAILATDVLPHRVEAAAAMGATHALRAEDAIAATHPGGRVVLLGIPDGDRTSFSASRARRKGLTLLLSRRMAPGDLPRAIRLVESGRVELVPLLTERCALSEWRDAFDALVERRGLKVVIEPQRVSEEEN